MSHDVSVSVRHHMVMDGGASLSVIFCYSYCSRSEKTEIKVICCVCWVRAAAGAPAPARAAGAGGLMRKTYSATRLYGSVGTAGSALIIFPPFNYT